MLIVGPKYHIKGVAWLVGTVVSESGNCFV